MKKRVTGLGGVFFKAQDPKGLNAWYGKHLGLNISDWGSSFSWIDPDNPERTGQTVWSTFKADTQYFAPSEKPFMFNYRVENLSELLAVLRSEGVQVMDETEESEYGKFGWIIDPEGNKIELWEPPLEMPEE
jgi:predicted enzyme related to lactoylglutathione lyase